MLLAGRAIVICVIDNLVKGASGQALQNMNLVMGIPEETGLLQQVSASSRTTVNVEREMIDREIIFPLLQA